MEPRIALVEIGGSHDECLLTQVEALASISATIIFVTTKIVFDRNPYLHPFIDEVYFVETEGRAVGDLLKMRRLVKFLQEKQVEKVVFNTAQGGHIRNLALLMPKKIECYGIIHTIRKFQGSSTQRVINRMIRKYLVLSDDLLKQVKIPSGVSVGSFYPVCFPSFEKELDKPEGETWITVTGGVENRRKDLDAVVRFIAATPGSNRFVFLGKTDRSHPDAQAFLGKLEKQGLSDRVKWYPEFVDAAEFHGVLCKTDFLLPLIHPNTPSSEEYISNQISGAFTLSYSYRIPLLIHQDFKDQEDLAASAVFYNLHNFPEVLEGAVQERKAMSYKIGGNPKWTKDFQKSKYLGFLGLLA